MQQQRNMLVAVVVAIPVLLLAVLAWQSGKSDDGIAKGVTVQGVPVGGLSVAAAKARLTQQLQTPAQRAVEVKAGKHTFHLTAQRAGVKLDIDGAVALADRAGEDGSFLSRGWRQIAGGDVSENVPLRIQTKPAAVRSFVGELRSTMRRKPRDAALDIKVDSVHVTREHWGRAVAGADGLISRITSALQHPDGARAFKAHTVSVKPKTTKEQVFDKTPVVVTVSKSQSKVRVFKRGEVVQSYGVSVGSDQYPTTEGQFVVQTKQVNPVWNVPNSTWAGGLAGQTIPGGAANNPLKARWIGFNGGEGFHGSTDVGGGARSHGCVRMVPAQVIDLYTRVNTGTPVLIGA